MRNYLRIQNRDRKASTGFSSRYKLLRFLRFGVKFFHVRILQKTTSTTFCPLDETLGSVEHQSVGNFEHFVVERLRWNTSQLEISIFFQTGK